jgi:hypothetical protein
MVVVQGFECGSVAWSPSRHIAHMLQGHGLGAKAEGGPIAPIALFQAHYGLAVGSEVGAGVRLGFIIEYGRESAGNWLGACGGGLKSALHGIPFGLPLW